MARGSRAAHTLSPTATGAALLAIIPEANTTNGGFPAVSEIVACPTTWREELLRVDQNISDNYHLTFRYIHDSWQTVVPNALWGNGTSFQNITTNFTGPGTSFVARLNANISPTLLNEFVASYTADHIDLTAGGPVGTTYPRASRWVRSSTMVSAERFQPFPWAATPLMVELLPLTRGISRGTTPTPLTRTGTT